MKWRNMETEKPDDGEECLIQYKHGFISATYYAEDDRFGTYVWVDISDIPCYGPWIPLLELTEDIEKEAPKCQR